MTDELLKLRPCNKIGCPASHRNDYGFCDVHQALGKKAKQSRVSSTKRGYNYRWQKARITWLKSHPLCRIHSAAGIVKAAEVIDHIVPHDGDQVLFWDKTNWQPLCKSCHDHKTATEDGGFGRKANY
jgi:5-methylcytosine-specific restriction protein A